MLLSKSKIPDLNALGKDMQQLHDSGFIIDKTGKILTSTDIFEKDINANNEEYVIKIKYTQNQFGYFKDIIKDVPSLIIYAKYKQFDWTLVRIIPLNNIMDEVNVMKISIFIISFIILVLGCTVAFFISRRVYRPFKTMLSRLSVLEVEMNSTLHTKRNEYLKNFLLGDHNENMESIPLNMKALKANFEPGCSYILLNFLIDHFNDFSSQYNIKDRALLKFAVINIASELCDEYFVNDGIDIEENAVVIMLNITADKQDSYLEILEPLIKNIQACTKSNIMISLTAVISSLCDDYTALSSIYNRTRSVSYERFFTGHESILYCEASNREYIVHKYSVEKEKKLVDALLGRNIARTKELYLDIVEDFRSDSYNNFRLVLLRLISAICSSISMIEKSLGITFDYDFESFISRMDKMETIEEVNAYYISLFDHITLKLNGNKYLKHNELIEDIADIVKSYYMDANCSLELVAEKVNMSPAYLGRLYNKLMASSLVDYINKVRIEHAKELLINSERSLADISITTGYTNIQHFYRVFKR